MKSMDISNSALGFMALFERPTDTRLQFTWEFLLRLRGFLLRFPQLCSKSACAVAVEFVKISSLRVPSCLSERAAEKGLLSDAAATVACERKATRVESRGLVFKISCAFGDICPRVFQHNPVYDWERVSNLKVIRENHKGTPTVGHEKSRRRNRRRNSVRKSPGL